MEGRKKERGRASEQESGVVPVSTASWARAENGGGGGQAGGGEGTQDMWACVAVGRTRWGRIRRVGRHSGESRGGPPGWLGRA
jgi:hypothetical protein